MSRLICAACAVAFAALALLLSGCALPERGAISGTKFDFAQYGKARVGFLPIAINPQYSATDFPDAALEQAVTHALGNTLALRPLTLQAADLPAQAASFPLTPQRLSALSRQLGYDGLIGVSVSSWSAGKRRRSDDDDGAARVDLTISYASSDPSRGQWTISGTWPARSVSRLAEEIETGLPFLLLDLKYSLGRNSVFTFFSEKQQNQPQLTYVTPQVNVDKHEEISKKYLDFQITSVDEAGVVRIEVVNEKTLFRWTLNGAKNDQGQYPIYLASKLRVPLAHGENRIVLTSNSADAARKEARREVKVVTSAEHEMFVMAIGLDDYQFLGNVSGASKAATELALAAKGQSRTSYPALTGESAHLDAVYAGLSDAAERLSVGDSVLISFSGRALPLGSSVFLALADVNTAADARSGSFLRVEDMLRLGPSTERVIVLDLCAEPSDVSRVRQYFQSAIPLEQSAVIRLADCDSRLGALALAAAEVLARKGRLSFDTYHGKPFFQDFQRALQERQAAGSPSRRTDIVFKGDGQPPVVATTEGNGAPRKAGFAASLAYMFSPAEKVVATADPFEFYVVSYSTRDEDDALREARRLIAAGRSANVVLGTSGFYGVAIGHAGDVSGAYDELKRAMTAGEASADAFVLPRSRIEKVIF